jgi:hypothetical protein
MVEMSRFLLHYRIFFEMLIKVMDFLLFFFFSRAFTLDIKNRLSRYFLGNFLMALELRIRNRFARTFLVWIFNVYLRV